MQVYDIVSQTAYGIELQYVDIEDAGDEFLTNEEVDEMGIHQWDGYQPNKSAIISAIEGWVAQIPEGKKSIKCTDAALIEALMSGDVPISWYVSGLRRVGDRISKHTPSADGARVLKPKDLGNFIYRIERYYHDTFGHVGGLRLDSSRGKKYEMIPMLKRLITWEEFIEHNSTLDDQLHRSSMDQEILDLIKPLWDNPEIGPTMFPEKKKKV